MSQSPAPTEQAVSEWGDSADDVGGDLVGQPRLLRVTCPQGHTLDAPCTLNGQQVVCPYCSTRFLLSYEKSEQYQNERPLHATDDRPKRRSWIDWVTLVAVLAIIGTVVVERSGWLDWL